MKENKSDTLKGFEFLAGMEPMMNFAALVLGWFTITVVTFLRRDFGERYYTQMKFMIGLMVLGFFYVVNKIGSGIAGMVSPTPEPQVHWFERTPPPPPPSTDSLLSTLSLSGMTWVILLYLLIGGYHFFCIWWRNGTQRPLHSADHGKSWLVIIGAFIMPIPNFFLGLIVRFYALTLPSNERPWLAHAFPVMRDPVGFTDRFIEPLVLLLASVFFMVVHLGALSTWLAVSSIAVLFATIIRQEQEVNNALDVRDNMIDSVYMQEAMSGDTDSLRIPYSTKKVIYQVVGQAENSPEVMDAMHRNYPSIAEAMEAISPKLKGMAGKKETAAPPPAPPPVETVSAAPTVVYEPPVLVAPIEEGQPIQKEDLKQESGLSVEEVMRNMKTKPR
jgi:hypothetical protein